MRTMVYWYSNARLQTKHWMMPQFLKCILRQVDAWWCLFCLLSCTLLQMHSRRLWWPLRSLIIPNVLFCKGYPKAGLSTFPSVEDMIFAAWGSEVIPSAIWYIWAQKSLYPHSHTRVVVLGYWLTLTDVDGEHCTGAGADWRGWQHLQGGVLSSSGGCGGCGWCGGCSGCILGTVKALDLEVFHRQQMQAQTGV